MYEKINIILTELMNIDWAHILETTKNIVTTVARGSKDPSLEDLVQDIMLILLEKPPDLIHELYVNDKLDYYITRIALNQVHSNTSNYYYTYKKHKHIPLNEQTHYIQYD